MAVIWPRKVLLLGLKVVADVPFTTPLSTAQAISLEAQKESGTSVKSAADADTQQIEIAMQRVSRIQVSLFIRLQFLSLCCRGQTVRRILARKLSKAVDYHRKV